MAWVCGAARVLIVNTKRIPAGQRPRSILDLADPKWRGRAGMAKPLFGTTATQAACLFAAWGPPRAKKFFHDLKRNEVQILSGNKQVAQAVSRGGLDFGLTDTDDALIEVKHAEPVEIVYPDQGPGGLGTLFIPNTVAIIKGGPHPEAARRLVDYLLSPPVEIGLAEGDSAQNPAELHGEGEAPRPDPEDRPRDGGRLPAGGRPVGRVPRSFSVPSSPARNK